MNDHVEIGSQENCSCIKGLSFSIESLALGRLSTDGTEALDAQLLACLNNCLSPTVHVSIPLHGSSRSFFRDHFASLVPNELVLGEAAYRLHLSAPEDRRLSPLSLGNDALLHSLHGFHSLHSLHRKCHLRRYGSRLLRVGDA